MFVFIPTVSPLKHYNIHTKIQATSNNYYEMNCEELLPNYLMDVMKMQGNFSSIILYAYWNIIEILIFVISIDYLCALSSSRFPFKINPYINSL